MDDFTVRIKNDKDRETKTLRVVETLHQGFCCLDLLFTARLAWIVVDVDVDEVIVDNFCYVAVLTDKFGKAEGTTDTSCHQPDK